MLVIDENRDLTNQACLRELRGQPSIALQQALMNENVVTVGCRKELTH